MERGDVEELIIAMDIDQTQKIPSFDEYQRLVLNRTLDYVSRH